MGDPDGTGLATVTVDGTTGQVCVNITTSLIDPMTLMHIHTGASDRQRAGLRRLRATEWDGDRLATCVTTTPANAPAIIANPAGHYLNVHYATFPNGAIRGQLAAPVLGRRIFVSWTHLPAPTTRGLGRTASSSSGPHASLI